MGANPYAATWRDRAGEIVGTTSGSTICWYPRRPSKLASVSDDGRRASVIRCGFCIGCRELDRRRVADRLRMRFADTKEDLWLVEIKARSESSVPTRILRSLTRRLPGRSGFLRLGPTSLALVVLGEKPTFHARILRMLNCSRIERISKPAKRRSWSKATRGLLVSRDEYGADRNRFYMRGLPRLERERWNISKRAGVAQISGVRVKGIRAADGDRVLLPPQAWKIPRLLHRRGPERRRLAAAIPIGGTVESVLASIIAGASSPASLTKGSRAQSARSGSSMSEFRIAPPAHGVAGEPQTGIKHRLKQAGGATDLSDTRTERSSGRGYRTSDQWGAGEFDAWAERMAAIARSRERKP
jgi:hypothetical protein